MQMTVQQPGGGTATTTVPDEQLHYHTDHLGSIRLVTNAAGNKVSDHEYLPYGQELTAAGNGVMKFTGHERDSDTGMDYMHARFYTSYLGRFMGADSVMGDVGGATGSWNRYQYGLGNPMQLVDPNGLDEVHFEESITVTAEEDDAKLPEDAGGGFSDSITVTGVSFNVGGDRITYVQGAITPPSASPRDGLSTPGGGGPQMEPRPRTPSKNPRNASPTPCSHISRMLT